ncbi:MAG: hypothetical protein OQK51_24690 [Kangiellaceae bacterium]|nr:hypothetical protein [Kangiellaceae bacterium]
MLSLYMVESSTGVVVKSDGSYHLSLLVVNMYNISTENTDGLGRYGKDASNLVWLIQKITCSPVIDTSN